MNRILLLLALFITTGRSYTLAQATIDPIRSTLKDSEWRFSPSDTVIIILFEYKEVKIDSTHIDSTIIIKYSSNDKEVGNEELKIRSNNKKLTFEDYTFEEILLINESDLNNNTAHLVNQELFIDSLLINTITNKTYKLVILRNPPAPSSNYIGLIIILSIVIILLIVFYYAYRNKKKSKKTGIASKKENIRIKHSTDYKKGIQKKEEIDNSEYNKVTAIADYIDLTEEEKLEKINELIESNKNTENDCIELSKNNRDLEHVNLELTKEIEELQAQLRVFESDIARHESKEKAIEEQSIIDQKYYDAISKKTIDPFLKTFNMPPAFPPNDEIREVYVKNICILAFHFISYIKWKSSKAESWHWHNVNAVLSEELLPVNKDDFEMVRIPEKSAVDQSEELTHIENKLKCLLVILQDNNVNDLGELVIWGKYIK